MAAAGYCETCLSFRFFVPECRCNLHYKMDGKGLSIVLRERNRVGTVGKHWFRKSNPAPSLCMRRFDLEEEKSV